VSLPFYLDHHIHSAIRDGLRSRGIDVLTTIEDGSATWDDELILQRASELGRVVYTQDTDFLRIAHEWADAGREFPVWSMAINFRSRSARLSMTWS
jgi:predicted nuclease of predicted toxin-antitoxin system